jgi:uncharacterized protein YggT (Ycf19 family)
MSILFLLINIYQVVLFIRFIMQWIDKDGTNQVNSALKPLTEPVMDPLRPHVVLNGIDFSALVVSIILQIIVVIIA